MKIDYHIAGSGSWVSLMDVSNGDTIEPWEPSYSAHHRTEELASNVGQNASIFTDLLGNIRCDLPLHSMAVTYASAQAALAASRTVPAVFLNNKIHLKVTEGSEVQYFPNAVCTKIKPNVQGATVVYTIDLVTGMVTSTDPAA